MNINFLLPIIILAGVILLVIKAAASIFNKEKKVTEKEKQIYSDFQSAIKKYKQDLKNMEERYYKLYNEFVEYKQQTENAISEMSKYSDKIIEISDKIIAFDDDFEEKLNVWCDLLDNPENSEAVKEQIREHLERDIKLTKDIKAEHEQQRMQRQQNIRHSFGLET